MCPPTNTCGFTPRRCVAGVWLALPWVNSLYQWGLMEVFDLPSLESEDPGILAVDKEAQQVAKKGSKRAGSPLRVGELGVRNKDARASDTEPLVEAEAAVAAH